MSKFIEIPIYNYTFKVGLGTSNNLINLDHVCRVWKAEDNSNTTFLSVKKHSLSNNAAADFEVLRSSLNYETIRNNFIK